MLGMGSRLLGLKYWMQLLRPHDWWLEKDTFTGGLNMMKTLAGRPLTLGVEGEELVIRIGVDTLQFCFETGEENQPYDEKAEDFRRTFKIVDKNKFAKGVGIALCNEEEDGSTPLTKVLDEAFIHAVENDEGVDEDGRIVTSEMLKYHGSRQRAGSMSSRK